ncbi:DUF1285 domain-containing protein [Shewanella sp. KX20019]|uniref:DUF1285 domain-containing protein n=1 Tax=Shewanella sp. KX20019 TaxID=2803864 RepID=UPI0019294D9C|nr:DUF1285 domain-containing protein [Shewanella sp. KX20019]QQX78625.1 DUF1285 domain-containing protein [Shewanella sp. KX20019]
MTSKISNASDAITSLKAGAPLCADKAIFEIIDNGDWFYQDGKLPLKFSKLFASILNKIDDEYFLITPVEKLKVDVANQALIIVDYDADEQGGFELLSSIDTRHSISSLEAFIVSDDNITLTVERGVIARLNRACFYRFINEFIA